MVEGGPIDVLTGDWLAELTMLILSRIRAKQPGRGFAGTFVTQMEQVMGKCLDRGIKVVSNAGGLDPAAAPRPSQQVADRLGLSPTIAYVDGDDLMPRIDELAAAGALRPFEPGERARRRRRFVTANAYFGCWGIVDALAQGADIVITGRVTDAAVACGPAAWHHGWARDDWDALAGAVVAGHVIECGAQATGGNYSFFTEVPGMERLGFPWAEVAARRLVGDRQARRDGRRGVDRHRHVAAAVRDRRAALPRPRRDRPLRHDPARAGRPGPGAHQRRPGEPPPPTLKVAMNELGGYRNDLAVALTGLDIEAKASGRRGRVLARPARTRRDEFASVARESSAPSTPTADSNEAATAQWRITVKDADERKVGRAFSNALIETALASIPGFYGRRRRAIGGDAVRRVPAGARARRPRAAVRPRLRAHARCRSSGRRRRDAVTVGPRGAWRCAEPQTGPTTGASARPRRRRPLGRQGRRRQPRRVHPIGRGVRVARRLPHRGAPRGPAARDRTVCRSSATRSPTCASLNFVIHGLLEEGVAASSRIDAQAKSLGEWLRARVVDIPDELLDGA